MHLKYDEAVEKRIRNEKIIFNYDIGSCICIKRML